MEAGQVRLGQGLLGQGQLLAELAVQLGVFIPGLGAPLLLPTGHGPQLLDGLGPELLRPPVGADLDIGDVVLQRLILRRLGPKVLRLLPELLCLLLELAELILQLQAGIRRCAVLQHGLAQGAQLRLHGAVPLLQAAIFLLQSGNALLTLPRGLLDIADHVLPVKAAEQRRFEIGIHPVFPRYSVNLYTV